VAVAGIFVDIQHVAGIEEGLRALVQASWSESTGSMLHFFDPDIDRSSIANYMQDL
jgi:hypothetical protein